ncbi:MAG TPA: antibiotic biosynthesis monooxygenase [Gaiellaceae bacterium]|nr:antibiotic biosynthesis monooxygenase [Gaiellaceae bacterium]
MSDQRNLVPKGAVVAALAIHAPRPEHRADWIAVMQQVGATSRDKAGCLGSVGFRDLNSDRLVAVSYWESEAALGQVLPAAVAGATALDERWGAAPTDVFVLRPLQDRGSEACPARRVRS